MENTSASEKATSKLATELFGVLVFYLYFGGWVYASDILGAFGISLGNTDVPAYYLIVYAYTVFFRSIWGWLLLIAIGGSWYALARYRFIRPAELLLLVVVAALPFPLIRSLAATRARADAAYLRDGRAKAVKFLPRTATVGSEYDLSVRRLFSSGKMRLVLQTKDRYFVFVQPPGEGGVLPAAQLYDVPTEDFVAVVSLRDVGE
jgi:hypothetical protein